MVDEDGLQRAVDVAFARLACEGYQALAPAQRILVCVWAACGVDRLLAAFVERNLEEVLREADG